MEATRSSVDWAASGPKAVSGRSADKPADESGLEARRNKELSGACIDTWSALQRNFASSLRRSEENKDPGSSRPLKTEPPSKLIAKVGLSRTPITVEEGRRPANAHENQLGTATFDPVS